MADPSKFYLGVDGGGTKTKGVLIDKHKKIIARYNTTGSNANVFGYDFAVNQVYQTVKKILKNLKDKKINILICLALAGMNTHEDKTKWQEAIRTHAELSKLFGQPPQILIVNDITAALRSGTTDKNAVAVIAGTGSSCYGTNEFGETAKSGGVDYILNDDGSGYDIGLKILKSVTRDLDGRGPKTALTKLLFDKFKINSLEALSNTVYKKPFNKTDIANIAPLAEIAAEGEDVIAKKIIAGAAHDLAVMIKAVATKLNLKERPYTIVTSGSIFKIQKLLSQHLKNDIANFSPHAKLTKPNIDSATAAAYLALENKF